MDGTPKGTGFLISPDGFILTNAHVVCEARELSVVLFAGPEPQERKATLQEPPAIDQDLAVLKSSGQGLPYAFLGDSDRVGQQEKIIVIGFPEPGIVGVKKPTVTSGDVIRTGVRVEKFPGCGKPIDLEGLIMTNASGVGQGNSGGPMFNAVGKVIGIVNGGIRNAQGILMGIAFAIPINVAIESRELDLKSVLPPYPPEITFIKFPNKIIADKEPYRGNVGFWEPNQDLVKARFSVKKGRGVEVKKADKITSEDFVLPLPRAFGKLKGEFEFEISVTVPLQEVTLELTLTDERGNQNKPQSFSFSTTDFLLLTDFTECRKKPPVIDWGAFRQAREFCDKDPVAPEDRGDVMKIKYDVSAPGSFSGFWMKWEVKDFDPNDWEAISFFVRGDPVEGFTSRVKVELKIRERAWGWKGTYFPEEKGQAGITRDWGRITIPLDSKFRFIDEWQQTDEFVIAFISDDVTAQKGGIFIDHIVFQKKCNE